MSAETPINPVESAARAAHSARRAGYQVTLLTLAHSEKQPHTERLFVEQSLDGISLLVHRVHDVDNDTSPLALNIRSKIQHADDILREHPELEKPEVITNEDGEKTIDLKDNPVSEMLYGQSETLRHWFTKLVPSAFALLPLQHPDAEILPSGDAIDDVARAFFRYGLDATSIRSRAEVMRRIIVSSVERTHDASNGPLKYYALGSGAADPNFAAIASMQQSGIDVEFHAVDMDKAVLDYMPNVAKLHGVDYEKTATPHQNNLIRDLILTDRLINELGEGSAEVVDVMGVFEYFDEAMARKLLAQAYRLVKPGGTLIIGNMLSSREQLEFNQRGVGWTGIKPRSIDEVRQLIEDCELEATFHMAADGVYLVPEIRKPLA